MLLKQQKLFEHRHLYSPNQHIFLFGTGPSTKKHLIATNGTTQIIFSDSTEDIKKMYESENIAMHEGLDVDTFIHRVAGLKIQRVQVDNRDSVTVYNIPDSKIQKSNTLRMFGKNARVISCEVQISISKREKNIKFDYINGIANVQRGGLQSSSFSRRQLFPLWSI